MVCNSSAVFEPWRWISNSSYFEMVKRIKTKNNNDNRKWMSVIIIVIIFTVCLHLPSPVLELPPPLCSSSSPLPLRHFRYEWFNRSVWAGGTFTSTNFTFQIYILYKLCGEHLHSALTLSFTNIDRYTLNALSTTAQGRYIYRGGWEDLSTLERKFMAYRQCHIWKIIHNI